MSNNTKTLFGLTDPNIHFEENHCEERCINGQKAMVITGKLTYTPTHCEKCGQQNNGQIIKHGTHTTRSQLPPYMMCSYWLELRRSRFLCKNCGKTFNAKTPLVEENCSISNNLKYKIALELRRNISRKDISELNFVSDVTVLNVLKSFTGAFKPNFNVLPSVINIDEFRSMKSSKGSMSFIYMDGHTNKILGVLENRQLGFLKSFFYRYSHKARRNVRYLVMDMNAPYAQLIKAIFPNAQIITDRFHIVQHANRAFNTLRVKVMKQYKTNKKEDQAPYRHLKRFWKLLVKNSSSLDSQTYRYNRSFRCLMSQQGIVDKLLSYSHQLRKAYETCQLLLYYVTSRNSEGFFDVIDHLDNTLPEEFRKKLLFFKKYKQGITNAFDLSYSNGPLEGTNNKIKVMKRIAYGYRNFSHFRARIYLIQGLLFTEKNKTIKKQAAKNAA